MEVSLHSRDLRAVVYSRVSTGMQVDGTSLDSQDEQGLRCCKERQAQVVDMVRDEGVSGALFLTRPGIQRALAHVREGRANALVVWSVDRMGRDLDVLTAIRNEVRLAGGHLIFSDGSEFADNASGTAMFQFRGTFAEYEKAIIRERTMNGKADTIRKGVQAYRGAFPYGYRIVRHDDVIRGTDPPGDIGRYHPVEPQAATVRYIYQHYAAGLSYYSIAVALNYEGVPAPRGGRWAIPTIQKILANPVYKGKPRALKEQRLFDKARPGTIKRGRALVRESYLVARREPGDVIELEAPAIVSEELWDRCQQLKAANRSLLGGRAGNETRHLLTTFLKCPKCGRGMVGDGRRYYRCANNRRVATHPCDYGRHLKVSDCDAAVVRTITRIAEGAEMAQAALDSYREVAARRSSSVEDTWERIHADEKALASREEATVRAQIAGIQAGADPETYNGVFAEIRAERAKIANRSVAMMEIEKPEAASRITTAAQAIQTACARLRVVMTSERVSVTDRRRALMQIIEKIVPSESELRIQFIGWPLDAVVSMDGLYDIRLSYRVASE